MSHSDVHANTAASARMQEKFDFYAIGLAFTVLGLSIQTASMGRNPIADAAELLAWLMLLRSGIIGIKRLENSIHVYRAFALRHLAETHREEIRKAAEAGSHLVIETGAVRPIADVYRDAAASVQLGTEEVDSGQSLGAALYGHQKRLLLAGFVLLVVSRAWIPATRLTLAIAHWNWTTYF